MMDQNGWVRMPDIENDVKYNNDLEGAQLEA